MRKKPEILAPAGSMEKLKFALRYGADAVYLGGDAYSLRAQGGNFAPPELEAAVAYAKERGKKAYVTVNIYPHEADLSGLGEYFRFLANIGADGVLVSDLGAFSLARAAAPSLKLHISTQANTINSAAVKAWEKMGASRIVLGRELTLQELKEIRAKTDIELEIFVHGAMCMAYSGRCLLSSYLTGKEANRGDCTQPCRWKYHVVEEKRPGQFFPLEEDARGTYIFNAKDLCLLPKIGDLIALGLDSLKIEGRRKSIHYVATVAHAYRQAVDDYFAAPDHSSGDDAAGHRYRVAPSLLAELEKISHRRYSLGFLAGNPQENGQIYDTAVYEKTAKFVGIVLDCAADGLATIEQRNHFRCGDSLEIFSPDGDIYRQTAESLTDEAGNPRQSAPHPQEIVRLKLARPVPPLTIIRKI